MHATHRGIRTRKPRHGFERRIAGGRGALVIDGLNRRRGRLKESIAHPWGWPVSAEAENSSAGGSAAAGPAEFRAGLASSSVRRQRWRGEPSTSRETYGVGGGETLASGAADGAVLVLVAERRVWCTRTTSDGGEQRMVLAVGNRGMGCRTLAVAWAREPADTGYHTPSARRGDPEQAATPRAGPRPARTSG